MDDRKVSGTEGKPRVPFAPNAEVYDASYYRAMYRPHWFLRNRRKYRERDAAMIRIVRPTPEIRILELGSARGDSAFFFAPLVKEVVGIDAAEEAVVVAREEARRRKAANVRFEPADARDLSLFLGESFDVVLLADFVEHVEDDVLLPALAESRRVLRAGGALAIYTPNLDHWAERVKAGIPGLQQPDHIAVRRSARVVEIVQQSGFSVEDLFFSASPYPLIGAVDRLFSSHGLCRFRTCLRARKN
jgi:SAM-dependent methyltransferase